MKAKRLLSAFVAVAMMVTMLVSFSTVASAETKPTIKVDFVQMTDDEFASVQSTTTCIAAEGSVGYWLVGTLKDYGTVDCPDDTSCGRKFMNINVLLDFENDVTTYLEQSSKMNVKMWKNDTGVTGKALLALANGNSKRVTIDFAATGYDSAYPNTVGASESGEITWIKVPVYVKAATPINATVAYANVTATTFEWGEISANETFSTVDGTINADETVTIGEAKQEATPSVSTEFGTATDAGIAVTREDGTQFTYDNCYTVTVKMSNTNEATKAGIQFIPALVLATNGNSWDDAAEAVFTTGLGAGEDEFTAALINIPRKFAGKPINMFARGFVVVDGNTITGKEVEKEITYTVTPEPGQN